MARKSHARCRVCGRARHIGAKFNLCQTCWQKRKPEHRAGWQAIKARRALKREDLVPVMTETPQVDIPELVELPAPYTAERMAALRDIKAGKVLVRRLLTDEQELEIIEAYTRTDESVGAIAERYNIKNTYPYNVLDRLGISWRRDNAESFDEWQAAQNGSPLQTPTPPQPVETRVLPPQIEAMRRIRPSSRLDPEIAAELVITANQPVWEISFVGKMLVQAEDVDGALRQARAGGHVTQIVGVNLRPQA